MGFFKTSKKEKVVIVMGTTGAGKSKLAIDLAGYFPAEIINSDKIQVYKGLPVLTNKATEEERKEVPHHLMDFVEPEADFTASDFRRLAWKAAESIIGRGRLPIIAGGSNSFVEELVEGENRRFMDRYDCCFLWVDVSLPELRPLLSERVDKMVAAGLVEEARGVFSPGADYTCGVRRAIGVAEMDRFFREEKAAGGGAAGEAALVKLREEGVEEIKENTWQLVKRQLGKIQRLRKMAGWDVHRLDATEAVRRRGKEEAAAAAWEESVVKPGVGIVDLFLGSG